MPPLQQTLAVRPGAQTQLTPNEVGAGITNCTLIRHRNQKIQKRGGCSALNPINPFPGVARCLFAWNDLEGNQYLAVATNQALELFLAGQFTNITPVAHTSNLSASSATPFTTTANSAVVTVADGGYSPAADTFIDIINAAYIGGILLQGIYQVVASGSGTYTITAANAALAGSTNTSVVTYQTFNSSALVRVTLGAYAWGSGPGMSTNLIVGVPLALGGLSIGAGPTTVTPTGTHSPSITGFGAATSNAGPTAENTGHVQIIYMSALPEEGSSLIGYGVGPYGGGPYGISSPTGNTQANFVAWSMCAWGQNLLAAYATGTIYQWVPPIAATNFAVPLANAPSQVNGIFIAAPQQQVFAWGAYSATLGEQDPLLLAWCDVADNTDWTASATNQAGTFRLSSGNAIVAGTWFGITGIIWTDEDFWLATYLGFPLVYGFNRVSVSCGLIAPRAWGILGTRIAWMSQNEFFIYQNGQVLPLPCAVRDFVFRACAQNNFTGLDRTQLGAIHCDSNTWFNEFMWRFPTVGSAGVCNAYVCWTPDGNLWDFGFQPQTAPFNAVECSAWVDQSALGPPIGADYNGLLEQFETSADYNGAALSSGFTTGLLTMAGGAAAETWEQCLPDFTLIGGNGAQLPQISMAFSAQDFLPPENAAYPARTTPPLPVDPTTPYVTPRVSGRFLQLTVTCTTLNTFWRYGKPLLVGAAEDRR